MDNNKKNPIIRFEEFKELYEKNGGDSNQENPYAWEQRKLGEFADISTGKLDANAMVEDGEYDFYTSGMKKYRIDTPAFEGPAITIAGNGATVGYMHLADGEFNAYQRTYVLQNFQANRYFLYSEISKKLPRKIAQEARTGNIPYIVMDMLTELTISLPVLEEEQAKIGAFFKQLDNTIALHQRKLEKSKALKSAYLSEMFPAEGERKPKRRFAGFTDDWEQCKVRELFTVTRGQVLAATKTKDKETDEFIYPVYSSQTKNNGLMGFYNQYLFENAITWTTDGANAGTVNFRKGKFYSTNVNGVLLSDKGYTNKAISEIINKIAWKHVSKVGNPKLMNNIMSEITIMIPSIEELNKISILFNQIDNTIALHQHKLEKLKNIKQAYLNELFV